MKHYEEIKLIDIVENLLKLNDENLAKRVIESNNVQLCLSELYDFLQKTKEE